MNIIKSIIEEIMKTPSISGFETALTKKIISLIKEKVDELHEDKLGNIIAFKKGSGKNKLKILYDAHLDQIGLIITKIENNGILRFQTIGGINPLTLFGKRVIIYGKKIISGIIGTKPPHLLESEEIKKIDSKTSLFIDTGYSNKKEVEKFIDIGDVALLDFETQKLLNNNYSSSAFDDKAGILTLIQSIFLIDKYKNYHDLYFLFSTQEEVGLRGAKVGTYQIDPDIALICDVTFADPVGNINDCQISKGFILGKGPQYSPVLTKKIEEIADREDIPYQVEIEPRPGGTNSYFIQINKKGTLTAGISIPLRYMHSQTEIINIKDLYRVAKIMALISVEETIV